MILRSVVSATTTERLAIAPTAAAVAPSNPKTDLATVGSHGSAPSIQPLTSHQQAGEQPTDNHSGACWFVVYVVERAGRVDNDLW